ncbi:AZOBR_p60025 family cell surface glycopolymer formation protein, partial [Candidatus Auribacterota bacterium]
MQKKKIFTYTLLPLLVITLIYTIVVIRYAKKFDRNITGFICIGDYFESPADDKAIILKNSHGYDGQHFYTIAHDPFIRTEVSHYPDNPAYRYGRILYPFLVYIFSLGNHEAIPYMMLFINMGAILIGSYFIIKILDHFDRSSWYALFYGFSAGFLLSTLRTLSEPTATLFVVIGIYAFLKEHLKLASFCFSLAVLARETAFLIVAAALVIVIFKNRSFKQTLIFFLPFIAYLSWQLYIYTKFGQFSFQGGTKNVGLPLVQIYSKIVDLLYLKKIHFSLESNAPVYQYFLESIYLLSIVLGVIFLSKQIFKEINIIT